jgi:diguanylate cyclase (GGDEF)-like protein/PAS domain S-box-containing protein
MRHRLALTPETRAQVEQRLDLTWSRLPLLVSGPEAAPLRRLESFEPVMDRVRAVLEFSDRVLADPKSDRGALDTMVEKLEAAHPVLHDFLTASMLTDELLLDQVKYRAISYKQRLYGSLTGMLLGGTVFVFLLLRQIRAVSLARQQAERQSVALREEMEARARAHTALRESEARFRDFAETAADCLWEMDGQLRFSYLSDRFQEVMGMPAAEVLGRDLSALGDGKQLTPGAWKQHESELADRLVVEDFHVRWRRPDGRVRHLSLSARPVSGADGSFEGYRGTTRDITQERDLAEKMAHLAAHDSLTGLVNRREFERRLGHVLETSRNDGSSHALCFLDLDQFKVVNDTCGHTTGDALIQRVAKTFSGCIRQRDTLGRIGGDEFGLLIQDCDVAHAISVAEKLRRAAEEMRFSAGDHTFGLGVSIGLVAVDADSENLTALLSAADNACYAAKDQGRNQVRLYQADDDRLAQRRGEARWLSEIHGALESDGFELVAQDIAPLGEGSAGGNFEILLRLVDHDDKRVLPGAFLPAAERYHVSPRIDRWVIRHALEWLADWRQFGSGSAQCFINLSGLSLGDEQMLDFITREIERTGVEPNRLCFEVTETAAISNLGNASHFFQALRARGCCFALDDFGSGVSSFGYLRTLPVDYLKIDGVFVRDIVDDPIDLAMVRSINQIGQLMGKKTIAEFVENSKILDALHGLGVDYAQGLHFGPPRPLAEWRTAKPRTVPAEPACDAASR